MRFHDLLFCMAASFAAGYFLNDSKPVPEGYDQADVQAVNLLAGATDNVVKLPKTKAEKTAFERWVQMCWLYTGFGDHVDGCPSYEFLHDHLAEEGKINDVGLVEADMEPREKQK